LLLVLLLVLRSRLFGDGHLQVTLIVWLGAPHDVVFTPPQSWWLMHGRSEYCEVHVH
jgi:hypothetical protein